MLIKIKQQSRWQRSDQCYTNLSHSPAFGKKGIKTLKYILNSSSSSSSSCRAGSTDIPDPLSPLFPIVHRLRHVFWTTSCVLAKLLNVCSFWSSCFCTAMCGVHRSTSLMSSSLRLQQCPACLVRLTWIVFVIGGRWPYCWCVVGCCRQDLFKIARSILV